MTDEIEVVITDSVGDWKAELQKQYQRDRELQAHVGELKRELKFSPQYRGSITIPLKELYSNTLLINTIEKPDRQIEYIKAALCDIDPDMRDFRDRYTIRFGDHPRPIEIRELRARDIGRLIAVRGLIKQVTEVMPKVTTAVYQCRVCNTLIEIPQPGRSVDKPVACTEEGCRSRNFKPLIERSEFSDNQKVRLQDMPEGLKAGTQPDSLEIEAGDDLCQVVTGGDRVVLTGILRAEEQTKQGPTSTCYNRYLDLTGITKMDEDFSSVIITEEDEIAIKEMAADPNLESNLVRSIAPSIYGHELIKLAIAMQLFGGVGKDAENSSSRLRGDFHLLLCGDPGIAKSQLLRFAATISPRGVFVTGKNVTKAGLTATAVNDAFGDGRWTLEAGAMVMADGGLVAADELDKMSKDDISAMHEAMEQQSISISKAGINTTLKARCSVLAACNPVASRFDMFLPLAGQTNLPATILDRFDLIFFMQDLPNPEMDRLIGNHILKSHAAGRAGNAKVEGPYDVQVLRKYIAYAKQNCKPEMGEGTEQALLDYYLKVRGLSKGPESAIPITARQMEGLIRLAEAHAKMRLSSTIDGQDARAVISLVDGCLKQIAYDSKTGTFDTDRISGVPKVQRDAMAMIKAVIKKLTDPSTKRAKREDLYNDLKASGLGKDEVDAILDRMGDAGILVRHSRLEVSLI